MRTYGVQYPCWARQSCKDTNTVPRVTIAKYLVESELSIGVLQDKPSITGNQMRSELEAQHHMEGTAT